MRSHRVPRASLSITMLRDADFLALMRSREGREAFAVFVAMVLVGRERLEEGRACRVDNTDALYLLDSTQTIAHLSGIPEATIEQALRSLACVATTHNVQPWLGLDAAGRITIRSFFRYNVTPSWGGARPNAGRPPTPAVKVPEAPPKPARPRFTPPTVEQVAEYCRERGGKVDAQAFHDFYAANGWVQGRAGKPIKDWRAAVRTWERGRFGTAPKPSGPPTPTNYLDVG